MPETHSPRRLHWGCGPITPLGWVNSDIAAGPGVDVVADIRHGLPLAADSFDYIVAIHVLPEIPYSDLDKSLAELRRVLRPGGVLRLSLPDMDLAIKAYLSGDVDYFLIGDEVTKSLAGKMIVQLTWYGRSRCMFTWEFTEELLTRNGFRNITRCAYRETASLHPGITELDDRPLESLFIEAMK
jgi:SAM-dependent methyltransferase